MRVNADLFESQEIGLFALRETFQRLARLQPRSAAPPKMTRQVPQFQPTERAVIIAMSLAQRLQNKLS